MVVRFPTGEGDISLLQNVQTGCEAHSASCSVSTGTIFRGVKRPGREADHSVCLHGVRRDNIC
jgi:hypothetical protein